jgi:signal transduction histidine kinase
MDYLQIKTLQQEFNNSGNEDLADSLKNYVGELAELNSNSHTLKDYLSLFQHYVDQAKEIGLDNSSGLYKALFMEAEILDKKLTKLTIKFESRYQKQIWTLIAILGVSALIIIVLSIVLSLVLARSLSKPISILAQKINSHFSRNRIDRDLPRSSAREVVMLNNTFNSLIAQVEKQVKEINDEKQRALEQNAELTKLNAELDRFIYHTSHDLRAPLTSIAGLIEVVESSDEENVYDYLNHMKFCINQLDQTIVEIIHFYKNRSADIRSDELNLSKIAAVVIDQNRFHPDAKKISFVNELDPDLKVQSDGFRFNIILGNLISNAIKYSDSYKANPFVRIWSEISKDCLSIHIEDNGIGISQEHLQKIFEMFYRASDKSTGSGLGLYITAESCKKIGVMIQIESELGEYTRITLQVPLHTVSKGNAARVEELV